VKRMRTTAENIIATFPEACTNDAPDVARSTSPATPGGMKG